MVENSIVPQSVKFDCTYIFYKYNDGFLAYSLGIHIKLINSAQILNRKYLLVQCHRKRKDFFFHPGLRVAEAGRRQLREHEAVFCDGGGEAVPDVGAPRPRPDLQDGGGAADGRRRGLRRAGQVGPRRQARLPRQGLLPLIPLG